ncbi:MAG: RagB/SusD family nutrient uptake outer membrane protein [Flammeovirgaceae bacterium]|nr:RagB/SusD family nutrient uptake outer membrane protein [Flammeovirgaceae bacterium]MBE62630.1 RagB/SusD family nutrient uptake outer membrane protein [Flammeovirgaceae bacterium]MBR07223.1 RagB/SusD family nutrient uptake outer membrane protein [Rickettsiales bacterium]HCX20540.1 RagB/SusD family nutrient uptake outer membrane protein [Cytophagales bacterium]
MKRYINYMLVTVLVFLSSACADDFLEFIPEDQATVDAWYRNREEIRQSTAALYGRPWWGYSDQFSWLAGDLMAGDMHHNWDQEGQFFYKSFNENNSYIASGWQGLYDVISYANLIIDDMPAVASNYGVSQDVVNAGLAEARFFRGAAYFFLVEYWEEAPIIEKPAEKVVAGNLYLPKNTAGSLYEFARRDFAYAAENLPATEVPGRVTSWAAKGMLAKLHLSLAQRAVGGGSIGSLEDFNTAASYAADVINNSGAVLYANYEDMFKIDNEHNSEILWAIQCINQGWSYGNSRQARFARHSRITGDAQAWGGGKCMTVSYLNNIENNAEGAIDLRRRAIFMEIGDFYSYIGEGYEYEYVSRDDEGVQLEGATPTLNSLKKYVVGGVNDHGYVISNQDSPLDLYMLRLSDVYLLYAEALLGSNSSLSSGPGYQAYLAVRSRAGLSAPADGNMTYQDLFNERRVELGLEAQSWLDVKRRFYRNSSDALNYLNGQNRTNRYYRIDSGDDLENDPSGYELVAAGGGVGSNPTNVNNDPVVTFGADDMILPVPGQEVISNPLLRKDTPAEEYSFD